MSFDRLPEGRVKAKETRKFLLQNAELTVCLVKMSDQQLDQFIDHLLERKQVPIELCPANRFSAHPRVSETPEEA